MAVLGFGGSLRLRRDPPESVTVTSDALDVATYSLVVPDPRVWTGDRVRLQNSRGLPFNVLTQGLANAAELAIPDSPDGYNMYAGGPWLPSSVRTHILNDSSVFYKAGATGDAAFFYVRASDVGQTTDLTYYVYRDQLDRLSFYTTRATALRGRFEDRVPLYNVDFGSLQLQVLITEADWHIQADLQGWTLNLTANEVDTTSIGDRFGDAIKDIISGGGSFDFLVDRTDSATNKDTTYLLNLLLMVEKGCEAEAEFFILNDRPEDGSPLLPGDLYYEARLLLVSQVINTRATEIVAGSADFVTVREIALRMGMS